MSTDRLNVPGILDRKH